MDFLGRYFLKNLTLILCLIFSLNAFSVSKRECTHFEPPIPDACAERHDQLEEQIINLITLNGTNSVRDIIIGSYVTVDPRASYHQCGDLHFVVNYQRDKIDLGPDREVKVPDSDNKVSIFRYFHFNEWGVPLMPPPELMYGKTTPINWESKAKLKNMDRYIEPSYRCERRFEWEYETALDIKECSKTYQAPEMASIVFPRKEFPYCEYHVFGMLRSDYNQNGNNDILFVHYVFDENGLSQPYLYLLTYPKIFKGKKIDYPKSAPLTRDTLFK